MRLHRLHGHIDHGEGPMATQPFPVSHKQKTEKGGRGLRPGSSSLSTSQLKGGEMGLPKGHWSGTQHALLCSDVTTMSLWENVAVMSFTRLGIAWCHAVTGVHKTWP